jgi:NAD(P)-dependent dehydrogenase (short-subunit alcohol dehydrogenase family)
MFSKNEKKPLTELISLRGKRALITGSASGIGKAIASRFAEAGADLELVDLDLEGLAVVRDGLSSFPVEIGVHRVDLAEKEEISGLWDGLGDVDVLVNNAGTYPERDFLEIDGEFLERVMNVNLNQVLWMSQRFISRRKGKGGSIINVASIEALLPFKEHLSHYSMAKAGVIALTRGLARDYGKDGFRANAILPGGIVTPGTMGMAKEVYKLRLDLVKTGLEFRSRLPLRRFGDPDEVARIALVLASELSSYVTGALVAVDGGFLSA